MTTQCLNPVEHSALRLVNNYPVGRPPVGDIVYRVSTTRCTPLGSFISLPTAYLEAGMQSVALQKADSWDGSEVRTLDVFIVMVLGDYEHG